MLKGECRCGVCACMCVLTCACVDGGAVMFKKITSYLGECVAAFVLTCGKCACVCACLCARLCVCFRVCVAAFVLTCGVCGCVCVCGVSACLRCIYAFAPAVDVCV